MEAFQNAAVLGKYVLCIGACANLLCRVLFIVQWNAWILGNGIAQRCVCSVVCGVCFPVEDFSGYRPGLENGEEEIIDTLEPSRPRVSLLKIIF